MTACKPAPSTSAVAVALAAAQLFVHRGSSADGARGWVPPPPPMLLSLQLRPCSLFTEPFPWLLPLVFGKLIVPRLLSLGQHDGWRLIQLRAAGAVAQRLEAAGWALCFGHGPAGGFFVCPSILLKSIVEEGCDRERSNKRCTCAAAAACARAQRARECACVCVHFAGRFGTRRGG